MKQAVAKASVVCLVRTNPCLYLQSSRTAEVRVSCQQGPPGTVWQGLVWGGHPGAGKEPQECSCSWDHLLSSSCRILLFKNADIFVNTDNTGTNVRVGVGESRMGAGAAALSLVPALPGEALQRVTAVPSCSRAQTLALMGCVGVAGLVRCKAACLGYSLQSPGELLPLLLPSRMTRLYQFLETPQTCLPDLSTVLVFQREAVDNCSCCFRR